MNRKLIFSCYLILLSMWWGWTVLVDMFIIRTVFSTIGNFFEAGDLGIAVFTKLNNLELMVASALVGLLALQITKNKKAMTLLLLSIFAWMITMTYFTYLTPKLVELTELWKKTDGLGITSLNGLPDIQQAHQFYHRIYIGLDVVKLSLLSLMIVLGVWKEEKWL